MILLLDNYDSFTFNLYQALAELGADVTVVRNDKISVVEVEELLPRLDGIVISPGPCTPNEAGISVPLIRRFAGRLSRPTGTGQRGHFCGRRPETRLRPAGTAVSAAGWHTADWRVRRFASTGAGDDWRSAAACLADGHVVGH